MVDFNRTLEDSVHTVRNRFRSQGGRVSLYTVLPLYPGSKSFTVVESEHVWSDTGSSGSSDYSTVKVGMEVLEAKPSRSYTGCGPLDLNLCMGVHRDWYETLYDQIGPEVWIKWTTGILLVNKKVKH